MDRGDQRLGQARGRRRSSVGARLRHWGVLRSKRARGPHRDARPAQARSARRFRCRRHRRSPRGLLGDWRRGSARGLSRADQDMKGEVVWDRGVALPGFRLWLDPLVVRTFAFISHAHTDHARRHKEALLTPQTLALIPESRRPRGWRMLGYGERMRRAEGAITLHSAGHMLGSAMLHFEDDGWSVLYTGDLKLRQPGRVETLIPKADVLIVESTYGRPHFRFGDPDSTLES